MDKIDADNVSSSGDEDDDAAAAEGKKSEENYLLFTINNYENARDFKLLS